MGWLGDINKWGSNALGNLGKTVKSTSQWIGNNSKSVLEGVKKYSKLIQEAGEIGEEFGVPFSKTIGKVAEIAGNTSDSLLSYYGQPGKTKDNIRTVMNGYKSMKNNIEKNRN